MEENKWPYLGGKVVEPALKVFVRVEFDLGQITNSKGDLGWFDGLFRRVDAPPCISL